GPTVTLTAAPAPVVGIDDDWESQVSATIASLSHQLDTIEQVERAWSDHRARGNDTPQPAALDQLLERKALLEKQETVLEQELVTWKQLAPVSAEIADYQRQLDELEQQLAQAPNPPPSAEHEESVQAL